MLTLAGSSREESDTGTQPQLPGRQRVWNSSVTVTNIVKPKS